MKLLNGRIPSPLLLLILGSLIILAEASHSMTVRSVLLFRKMFTACSFTNSLTLVVQPYLTDMLSLRSGPVLGSLFVAPILAEI